MVKKARSMKGGAIDEESIVLFESILGFIGGKIIEIQPIKQTPEDIRSKPPIYRFKLLKILKDSQENDYNEDADDNNESAGESAGESADSGVGGTELKLLGKYGEYPLSVVMSTNLELTFVTSHGEKFTGTVVGYDSDCYGKHDAACVIKIKINGTGNGGSTKPSSSKPSSSKPAPRKPSSRKPSSRKPSSRKPSSRKSARKVHVGPRGGKYVLKSGRKVYVS